MDRNELKNYRMLAYEVRQLRDLLASLEMSIDSPKSPRFTLTPSGSSHQGSPMEQALIRHLELQELYTKRLAEKDAKLQEVERAIGSLEDPAERVIMRNRYILGWSWRRVCMAMQAEGYSERQVYRLHGYALLKLKDYQ